MCNIFQPESALNINGLKDAFYSLKTNKSPGYDDISSNIIKQFFGTFNRPLHYIYNICLQSGVLPEEINKNHATRKYKTYSHHFYKAHYDMRLNLRKILRKRTTKKYLKLTIFHKFEQSSLPT